MALYAASSLALQIPGKARQFTGRISPIQRSTSSVHHATTFARLSVTHAGARMHAHTASRCVYIAYRMASFKVADNAGISIIITRYL